MPGSAEVRSGVQGRRDERQEGELEGDFIVFPGPQLSHVRVERGLDRHPGVTLPMNSCLMLFLVL